MIQRLLKPIRTNSFFLFGARGTGKSTFVQHQFPARNLFLVDLLNPELEYRYATQPSRLIHELDAMHPKPEWVCIDEIQKIPRLLDVVHLLIEKKHQKFILTGSSARKIKRGAANLLAGRAFVYHLFPFSVMELKERFMLSQALHWGMLPKVQSLKTDEEKILFLKSYTLTYLNEEIKAEQVLRKLETFRFFLPVLGQMSGKIVNHKKIADEIGVQSKTVQSYFQIIEDTLLGFYLPAFHPSVRKSQKLSPKFYLIDTGIKKALEESLEQKPVPRTSVYGDLFEQFVIQEIYKLNHYYQKGFKLSYYATKNHVEIDLILSKLGHHFLLEIKSTQQVDEKEVLSLNQKAQAFRNVKAIFYLSQDKNSYKIKNVQCWHWQKFLENFKSLA